MGKKLDLTGQKFWKLEVKSFYGRIKGRSFWNCVCECGTPTRVRIDYLRSGHTKSCGCLHRKSINSHDKDKNVTREVIYWHSIKDRCYNFEDKNYRYYGGRGIQVCERWLESFENFLEDIGECPEGLFLDLIDNDGDYEPGNVKWVTRDAQKKKIDNLLITYNGVTKTLSDWADSLSVSVPLLVDRIKELGNIELAFTTPVLPRKRKKVDLTGQKFGKLEVKSLYGKIKGQFFWNCLCDCGNSKKVRETSLGKTKSCGCLRRTPQRDGHVNGKRTREMACWQNMIYRCYKPKNKAYKDYGGRGIQVCERWRNSFENFLEDMGKCPDNMSIERIENDGNYEPSNCKWIPKKDQNKNRRNTVIITYNGETKNLSQWSTYLGMSPGKLRNRLKKWGDVEKAFTTPKYYNRKEITYKGETKTISEWAAHLGMSLHVIRNRLKKWGNFTRVFTTPIKKYKKLAKILPKGN